MARLLALLASAMQLAAWQLQLKPQASVIQQDGAAFFLIERLGHVIRQRGTFVFQRDSIKQLGLTFCSSPSDVNQSQKIRCRVHTRKTLSDMYILPDDKQTIEVLDKIFLDDSMVLALYDRPFLLPTVFEQRFLSFFSSLGDVPSQLNFQLARKALSLRYGRHPYPSCTETCAETSCVHKHEMDLPWLLQPLLGTRYKVSMLNIGCRDFGPGDPLASFLDTGTALTGLCVEKDSDMLRQARDRLHGHDVQTVELAVTPYNLGGMLEEYAVQSVDVIQLDIDCFEISVLKILLEKVMARVVILELKEIPPPFRFAAHFSSTFNLDRHFRPESSFSVGSGESCGLSSDMILYSGASLSYLVEFMGQRGFLLYKMNHMDHVWVHSTYAEAFTRQDEELKFPVDEWACWMDLTAAIPSETPQDLRRYTMEWFLLEDTGQAFERIWGNLTCLHGHVGLPFTLDLP